MRSGLRQPTVVSGRRHLWKCYCNPANAFYPRYPRCPRQMCPSPIRPGDMELTQGGGQFSLTPPQPPSL
jgi:hypothetical protein